MSTDVPDSVSYREVAEILRTFRDSHWRSITLDLHGMRITVGKDGPPSVPVADGDGPVTGGAPAGPSNGSAPGVVTLPAAGTGTGAPVRTSGGAGIAVAGGSGPRPSPADGDGAGAQGAGGVVAPPAAVDTTGCVAVRSPAIGAFWVAPSPGQAPFVEVGQVVAQDEQLAIVEVMKLMNPVLATASGEVVAVCASNAEMVEYEQVLFWVRPTHG